MRRIAIAVHGGAGPDSEYIKQNKARYEEGLQAAVESGYAILLSGGTAIQAVAEAVKSLEDNALFNAGRGSALNKQGEVEMDASIMSGENLKAGAVAGVTNIKNPVTLARVVLENTSHVLIAGNGAIELARENNIEFKADEYFVTDYQCDMLQEEKKQETPEQPLTKHIHGTVGAVALDENGNLAAATSTGGISNSLPGRIGDSCLIGAGCYANNNTCAVSGTGDGEYLITGVIAHSISSAVEYTKSSIQQACDLIVHQKNKNTQGDIGVISIDNKGEFGIAFNSDRMHRAWMSSEQPLQVMIY